MVSSYRRSFKVIFLKDSNIIIKNKTIYFDDKPLPKKTGHIFISGNSTISSKALKLLHEMRISVHLNYKLSPVYSLTPSSYSYLKRVQAEALGNTMGKTQVIKRMLRARSLVARLYNLPEINDYIDFKNLLLSEARYMRHIYKILSKRTGVSWTSKKEVGRRTALHFWWNQLYAAIHTCIVKMGLDADLGFMHTCERGFVYDVADILKPIFLEKALLEHSSSLEFWAIYKERRLNQLIPILMLHLIPGRRQQSYSSLRSHLGRVQRHNSNTPTP